MNWIKRAFRSISYHKKNTILMFLSFLILSILILFGLCIRAASRERIWEIRTSIGGSVLVSNERQIYSEEPRGVNSISHQKYLELCADEQLLWRITLQLKLWTDRKKMEQKIFMWRDHLILSSILVLFLL